MEKDFYKVLSVGRKADPEKIKRAYRKAAKRYHPDISPKDEDKFKEVQEAYETLSDPERRALYDRQNLKMPSVASPRRPSATPVSPPVPFFDEIDRFFSYFDTFWDDGPISSVVTGNHGWSDLSVEVLLTSEEARLGCKVPLDIPFRVECTRCGGTGEIRGLICGLCRGTGSEKVERKIMLKIPPRTKDGTKLSIVVADTGQTEIELLVSIRVD